MRHRRRDLAADLPKPAKDPLVAVYMDGALSVLFQAMQVWLSRGDIKEASKTAATLLRVLPEERPGAGFLDLMRNYQETDPEAHAAQIEALNAKAKTARQMSIQARAPLTPGSVERPY